MRRILPAGFFLGLIAFFVFLSRRADLRVLDPRGPIALAERNLMATSALLMLLVVVPVFFLLGFFAWRYRAGTRAEVPYTPDWEHNRFEEFVWWAVPFAIIFCLAVIDWTSSHALDPYRPIASSATPIEVEVVALDWKWLFIYPEQGIAAVNYLEVPANTPIDLHLTADAPMNSFWIPQLSGQIMVMPGMTTQLHILADGPGRYAGLSGNYSGDGFAGMQFTVAAVSPTEFSDWVLRARHASSSLSLSAYQVLAQPSQNNPPTLYASVTNGLYDGVVESYLKPSGTTSPRS